MFGAHVYASYADNIRIETRIKRESSCISSAQNSVERKQYCYIEEIELIYDAQDDEKTGVLLLKQNSYMHTCTQ